MNPEQPIYRRLRVFALDPSLAAHMDTATINEVVLNIPWEDLKPGPVGEYVKVIDEDQSGNLLYDPPVDLDDPSILASDGLSPSDNNPHFHQQMVYAVAMQTIGAFEKSLGRQIHWKQIDGNYIGRIKLHPHYMNEPNAAYDPSKGALMFGYFEATPDSRFPGTIVFTCLSQDVIAHQICHALLDGMSFQFYKQMNPDSSAFHEGFCDLVALLQRCAQPEFLRHQLVLTRGDLAGPSQLGILASQFGEAIGSKSGLRSAFGEFDENNSWHPRQPNPQDYETLTKPYQRHARGTLLLAAVFEALNRIYRVRVEDLFRISTEGTGILPEGELHPDLIDRVTHEAAKSAKHVFNMCVRALDYCPLVEITFGDYLRAIITADFDLVPNDARNYRLAFVEAFRRYGIYPAGVSTLLTETLLWPKPDPGTATIVKEFVLRLQRGYTSGLSLLDRGAQYTRMRQWCRQLEDYLAAHENKMKLLPGIDSRSVFVHSIWPCKRIGLYGESLSLWVIKIAQRNSEFLASHTLLVDADTGLVQYAIHRVTRVSNQEEEPKDLLSRFSIAPVLPPVERRLRVFAFDPSLATRLETMAINQVTLRIPWETVEPGPVGEYLEVVDCDPASGCFYAPVDLNGAYLLANHGYTPSPAIPQFHQQMVYAVGMRTIRNFEHALGRFVIWSPNLAANGDKSYRTEFVRRLRLYPHALREANAWYSPQKKAILFGYFTSAVRPNADPGTIFTCLSHDIIVHELAHALLDGIHPFFIEPSNPDVLAFHEAFADILALFQHFSLPEVLEHQIAATRGDLASQNRLGELAQQLGSAIGNRGALRSAIGQYDEVTGQWLPLAPDPEAYMHEVEPHARGALLVAAVFDAFLTLYRSRAADLFRIASKGTGVLPAGQLHPDLVKRLSNEAADSAQQVLEMCIRALDYCPPVDITFGDYLRAIITADYEYDLIDEHHRRVAFMEAFKRRGIRPDDARTYSLEGLLWKQAKMAPDESEQIVVDSIQSWMKETETWNLASNREKLFGLIDSQRVDLCNFLDKPRVKKQLGFVDPDVPLEVHSLRPSTHIDLHDKSRPQWIIEVTQWIPEFLDGEKAKAKAAKPDYYFRGGATLLVDAETGRVRYIISKPIDDQRRRQKQRHYMTEIANCSLEATYFRGVHEQEPFAALHRF